MRGLGRNPAAGIVEVGIEADGFDDGESVGADALGVFNDVLEGGAEIGEALREKIEGVGVAVDGGAVGEMEFAGDPVGAAPMEESFFDGRAVGVPADGAAAGVLREVGGGSGHFFVLKKFGPAGPAMERRRPRGRRKRLAERNAEGNGTREQ